MFRGIATYIFGAALKSRFIYFFILTLVFGMGFVYVFSHAQIQMTVEGEPPKFISSVTDLRSVLSILLSILIFMAVFSAGRILPHMLGQGTSGFFLSKPIRRLDFLACATVSIMIIYSAIIALVGIIVGSYYAIAMNIDGAFTDIILQVSLECSIFIVYVPIILLFGLMSRSGSYAFLGAFLIWLLAHLLSMRSGFLTYIGSDTLKLIGDTLYYILPKSSGISEIGFATATEGLMPLWSSVLTALAAWGLALQRFRSMEF